jgi:hypothetical protein
MEENINKEVTKEYQDSEKIDLPKLDLYLNMKTGECILNDEKNEKKYELTIDSENYTKNYLRSQIEYISNYYKISDDDKEYLKNIDSTILKAYMLFDSENKEKYNKLAAKMYIDAVICNAKKLSHGVKINEEDINMPGDIEIDLKFNLKQKDGRKSEDKFKGLIRKN